jgi:hypothetical protein
MTEANIDHLIVAITAISFLIIMVAGMAFVPYDTRELKDGEDN